MSTMRLGVTLLVCLFGCAAPASAIAPRVLSTSSSTFGTDGDRYVLYTAPGERSAVRTLDTITGERRRFPEPKGCTVYSQDARDMAGGRAVEDCDDGSQALFELGTGKRTPLPRTVVYHGIASTPAGWSTLGLHWVSSSADCGFGFETCDVYYNFDKGQTRFIPGGTSPADQDDPRFRELPPCAPFETDVPYLQRAYSPPYLVTLTHNFKGSQVMVRCPSTRRLLDLRPADFGDEPSIAHGLLTWVAYGYVYARAIGAERQVRFKIPRPIPYGVTSELTRHAVLVSKVAAVDIDEVPTRWRVYAYKLPRWLQRLATRPV